MFKFWKLIIEPILDTISARRLIEIGVAYGYCTQRLLEYCTRVDGHLDYIDPEPVIDVASFQSRYGPVSRFHRSTSLEALPQLQSADAVLIDGDHNWYTVFSELRLIEAKGRETGSSFPLVFFHDVCWPYGRRDLYYAPERLPGEYLQPYAKKGMVPGVAALVETGGLNPHLFNAVHEGGARNGVLTAVEDFLNQSTVGNLYVVPILHGLGILISAQLQQNEALMAEIRHWQSAPGLTTLLDFLERERLNETCQANADQAGLLAELQQLRAERDRLRGDLESLLASRTWRWSASVRSLHTFVTGSARRVKGS